VPGLPGTYVLVLVVENGQRVRVGRLGEFRVPPGWLAYVGSARGPGGLAARLARHLRHPKTLVWHIDFLRAVAQPVDVWWATGTDRRECLWAAALAQMPGASRLIPRFGASDCRCPTHLFHFPGPPDREEFARRVGEGVMANFPESKMRDFLHTLEEAIANGDDLRAEEAARSVGPLGDAALPALTEWQASPDRDRRWWAVRALAAVGTPRAVAALIAALEDPDPDVRACAVVGLASLRPSEAVEPLVSHLSDPSAYVARLAADALARIGTPAVPALIVALGDENVAARAGAARALCAIRPQEAIPALCAALDDPSALVTYYAEEALEQMGVGMVFFSPD